MLGGLAVTLNLSLGTLLTHLQSIYCREDLLYGITDTGNVNLSWRRLFDVCTCLSIRRVRREARTRLASKHRGYRQQ